MRLAARHPHNAAISRATLTRRALTALKSALVVRFAGMVLAMQTRRVLAVLWTARALVPIALFLVRLMEYRLK